MPEHRAAAREEWDAARAELLKREKELGRTAMSSLALFALTVGIATSPQEVLGLVVPGSHAAIHAMKAIS